MNKKEELKKCIRTWLKYNDKMRQITKHLYDHTELFERGIPIEYHEDLFNFFSGKITRFTRDENQLKEIMGFELCYEIAMDDLFE